MPARSCAAEGVRKVLEDPMTATVDNPRATILCVDDEQNQLLLRKRLLEKAGYSVVPAASYRSALSAFSSNAIDLAVLDYWLPGGNGIKLASELRRCSGKLPIVIISAYSELPGETIGLADAWIAKGAAAEELLVKVAQLLQLPD